MKIPAWWYFWPAGHDESLDLNRVVFLEENMPPELHRLSLAELTEVGVQQIPGEKAIDLLVQDFVDARQAPLSAAAQRAFAEGYMHRIEEFRGSSGE